MKRILMILEREYPPDVRVDKESSTLTSKGFEVHILSFNFGHKKSFEIIPGGIYVHRFYIHREVFRKSSALMNSLPLYQYIWKRNISKLMNKVAFDAIHVHDLPVCGTALHFSSKFGIPLIADMHENYPYLLQEMSELQYPLIKSLVNFPEWIRNEKKWLESSSAIVATCREMKDRLTATGLDPDRIFIVENTVSVDIQVSNDIVPDADYITMTYLGGINQNRGLDIVIRGFASIKKVKSNTRLWIVGDGRYKPVFEKLVNDLGIQDVTFWGWQSREESMKLIQLSDICLIPHVKSIHTDNTSPNKIFEYFNAGKPVLASNCNYLVRIIDETGAGLHYQHDSASDFERAFYDWVNSDINKFKLNARKAVIEKYNWDITSKSLIELYTKVVK